MAYPEWTKKFKSKGVYIGKNKYGFYLYRAHCIRDPETKKPKTIIDEYLGTISEEDGFIPKKNKFSSIYLKEFGLSSVIYFGFKRELERHVHFESLVKNLMICSAIIFFIYGEINIFYYHNSFLSERYPNIDFSLLNENRKNRCITLAERITTWFNTLCPIIEERQELRALLMNYMIIIDDKTFSTVKLSSRLEFLINKYNLEVKI